MAQIYEPRVADTSLTTGLGPISVTGIPPQINLRTFGQVMNFGDTAYVACVNRTANEWEEAQYIYTGTNQLSRFQIYKSSNGNQPVNFSAGIKDVFLVQPSKIALEADTNITFTGIATLNFGAFPGAASASLTVTGQGAILSTSIVIATVVSLATVDHTADEHWVDPPKVVAGAIVPGTGFTIFGTGHGNYAAQTFINGRPLKRRADMPYGRWSVAWTWK